MTNEQALKLADHLEDLAAMLTQKAERIRKEVTRQAQAQRFVTPLRKSGDKWLPGEL